MSSKGSFKIEHLINKEVAENTMKLAIGNMKMSTSFRSEGDGMEQCNNKGQLSQLEKGKEEYTKQKQESILTCASNSSKSFEFPISVKRKEPKFVPYEPYKAAITPLIPQENYKEKFKQHSKRKSNLVEKQIPFPLLNNPNLSPVIRVLRENADITNINRSLSNSILADNFEIERERWEEERLQMQEEIKKLKNSKRDIENQFKIQTQVNTELKKLLVASLGEDMQSRVQFLSEDKARLAEDISHYSQMLLEEHEELEKLAIQCDVWRSKFLACSLMVDELAEWKALLSRKYEEAKESIQWMLEERDIIKQHGVSTQQYLKHLQMVFDPVASQTAKRPVGELNLLSIAHANQKLADELHYRLLGSSGAKLQVNDHGKWDGKTPAEDLALRVLSTREIVGDNVDNRTRSKMCRFHAQTLKHDFVNVSGCRHCCGEIDVI